MKNNEGELVDIKETILNSSVFETVNVGDRVRLNQFERYPMVLEQTEGTEGVVVMVDRPECTSMGEPMVCVQLDKYYPHLKDWNNQLQIMEHDAQDLDGNITLENHYESLRESLSTRYASTPLRAGFHKIMDEYTNENSREDRHHRYDVIDLMDTLLLMSNPILRAACLDWLAGSDWIGFFTDDQSEMEGHPPMDDEGIIEQFDRMLNA